MMPEGTTLTLTVMPWFKEVTGHSFPPSYPEITFSMTEALKGLACVHSNYMLTTCLQIKACYNEHAITILKAHR